MNILVSAYSVNPFKGSKNAMGWNWIIHLSKNFNNPEGKINGD
ncbi:MAG: hypothetical protein ACLUFN_07030 [Eubacterium sp.]